MTSDSIDREDIPPFKWRLESCEYLESSNWNNQGDQSETHMEHYVK